MNKVDSLHLLLGREATTQLQYSKGRAMIEKDSIIGDLSWS